MSTNFPTSLDGYSTKLVNDVIQPAHMNNVQDAIVSLEQGGHVVEVIAYAASITPNAATGSIKVVGTLAGNITINAPTNPVLGRQLRFIFTQDSTGGRIVSWNAVFSVTNWTTNIGANTVTEALATYNGTNWVIALTPSNGALTQWGNGIWDATSPSNVPAAFGDGATDNQTAINGAVNAAGNGVSRVLKASQAFLTSVITTLAATKLVGEGTTLKPFANSQTVILVGAGLTLQAGDYLLIKGFIIDGNGKTGITALDGVNTAGMILENLIAMNCDTVAFNLENAQFVRTYNLKAALGNGTGMLIKNLGGAGGANSHDHYGLHLIQKEVGLVVNGTNFQPEHSLIFYNPSVLSNSVCGMAFFSCNRALIIGGAPEANGAGAATLVVDGQTVKRASMHLNASNVRAEGLFVAEASVSPCFIIENGSVLTLDDVNGYGATQGTLVQCDATSSVHLAGTFACVGAVQGVTSWPDAWILPASAKSVLYGEPVFQKDQSIPTLWSEQASTWTSSAGGNSPPSTNAFGEDAQMGFCRTVQYLAVVGDTNVSHVRFTGQAVLAGSQDTVISFLVKASVDCQMGLNTNCNGTFNLINFNNIFLKAGRVTRVILGIRNLPAGTFTLFVYPQDTNAPSVQLSNLQIYQGATGTQVSSMEIAKIMKLGVFNDGIVRETAANLALIAATVNAKAKYPGKQVWDTTNNRVVFAAGQASNAVWKDGVNSTVYTPI